MRTLTVFSQYSTLRAVIPNLNYGRMLMALSSSFSSFFPPLAVVHVPYVFFLYSEAGRFWGVEVGEGKSKPEQ